MQRERFELSNLPGLQHGSDIGMHVLCSENKKGRPWQRFILYAKQLSYTLSSLQIFPLNASLSFYGKNNETTYQA